MNLDSLAVRWARLLYYCAFAREPDSTWCSESARFDAAARFRIIGEGGAMEGALVSNLPEQVALLESMRFVGREIGLRGMLLQSVCDGSRVPIQGEEGVAWAEGPDGSIAIALEGRFAEPPAVECLVTVELAVDDHLLASSVLALPNASEMTASHEGLPATIYVGRKSQAVWLAANGMLFLSRLRPVESEGTRSYFDDRNLVLMRFSARRIGVRRRALAGGIEVSSLLTPTSNPTFHRGNEVFQGDWGCREMRTGVVFRRW